MSRPRRRPVIWLGALAALTAACGGATAVRTPPVAPPLVGRPVVDLRAALVLPEAVRATVYEGTPCAGTVRIEVGVDLERALLAGARRTFQSVDVVRERHAALGRYDLIVEIGAPRVDVKGSGCSGAARVTDSLLSPFALVAPSLLRDSTVAALIRLDALVTDGRGGALVPARGYEGAARAGPFGTYDDSTPHVATAASQALGGVVTRLLSEVSEAAPVLAHARLVAGNRTVRPALPAAAAARAEDDVSQGPGWRNAPHEHDVAVVIGVERYQRVPRSEYSGRDAEAVRRYLVALGVPERNIELLVDQSATQSTIRRTVEAWLPNRVRRESRVFVYYSGHGAPDPTTGDAYIVPHDGDPNYLRDTGYPLRRLYEKLGELPSSQVLLVLDSCFSGAGGRSVLPRGARPLVTVAERAPVPANVAVLASTQGSQISVSLPEQRHGLFTYYFLKALKSDRRDVATVYAFVKPAVEDEAKRQNVEQSPSLTPDPSELHGRFVLRD